MNGKQLLCYVKDIFCVCIYVCVCMCVCIYNFIYCIVEQHRDIMQGIADNFISLVHMLNFTLRFVAFMTYAKSPLRTFVLLNAESSAHEHVV